MSIDVQYAMNQGIMPKLVQKLEDAVFAMGTIMMLEIVLREEIDEMNIGCHQSK
jgi:uncharacterized ferritin-like protein (DUF455 family)